MNPLPTPASVTSLDPATVAATAASWDAQAVDLTASARAVADAVDLASGFTARVRPEAASFARAWSGLTSALAGQCQAQGEAMRAAAAHLVAADQASGAELDRVTTALGRW